MANSTPTIEVTSSRWNNTFLVRDEQACIGHVKSWIDDDGQERWLAFDAYPFTGAFTLQRRHTGEVVRLALAIPSDVAVDSQDEAVAMVTDFYDK